MNRTQELSTVSSEEVRSSLEMLDSILAEYDGSEPRKSASSDADVSNDAGISECQASGNHIDGTLELPEAYPATSSQYQTNAALLVNGDSSQCLESGQLTSEQVRSKKVDPPPVPKRKSTTHLSLSLDETLPTSVSLPEASAAVQRPGSCIAAYHSLPSSLPLPCNERVRCQPRHSSLSDSDPVDDDPFDSDGEVSQHDLVLRSSGVGMPSPKRNDRHFVPQKTTVVLTPKDGDETVFFGGSCHSLPGRLTDQCSSEGTATKRRSLNEPSSWHLKRRGSVDEGSQRQSGARNVEDHLPSTASTDDGRAIITYPTLEGRQQPDGKFNTIKRLLRSGRLPGLDEKPPCFRPPPPPSTLKNVIQTEASEEHVTRVLVPARPAPLPPSVETPAGMPEVGGSKFPGTTSVCSRVVVESPVSRLEGPNGQLVSAVEAGDFQPRTKNYTKELPSLNRTLSTFLSPTSSPKTPGDISQLDGEACLPPTASVQPKSRTALSELQRQSGSNVFFNVFSSEDGPSTDNKRETDAGNVTGEKKVQSKSEEKKKCKEKPEKHKGSTKGTSLYGQAPGTDPSAETAGCKDGIFREDIIKVGTFTSARVEHRHAAQSVKATAQDRLSSTQGEKITEKKGIFKSFWKRRHASDKEYHLEEIYRPTPID